MQRRLITPFNLPVNPLQGGKAGNKDPRGFTSGNIPGQQWDIEQQSHDRQQLDAFPPPQYSEAHSNRAIPDGIVRTVPTRINYVVWMILGLGANVPVLLVPRNVSRLDLTFSCASATANMFYSWGKPQVDSAGLPVGIRIPILGGVVQANVGGVIGINDIWVWDNAGGAQFFAFEGIEALEANP